MSSNKKIKKLNNDGLSLVELLVAITILCIVVFPLLSCFVTSMKLSAKAKDRQRLNAASQSIMEGFKAYSMEDLIKQFDSSDPTPLKIYNTASVVGEGGAAFDSIDSYSVDKTSKSWTYVDNSNPLSPKTYNHTIPIGTFKIKGLSYQGKSYDARIVTDWNQEDNDGDGVAEYDNIEQIRYIEDLNGYQDCIYLQKYDDFTSRYNDLLVKVVSKLNEIDKVYGYVPEDGVADPDRGYHISDIKMSCISIERETYVTIDEHTVTVKVDYIVHMNNHPYYGDDGLIHYYSTPAGGIVIPTEDVYYDNTATGAELVNIFLFVFPAYSSSLSGYPVVSDIYKIEDTSRPAEKRNVFFVKQYNTTIASNLETCESSYTPHIYYDSVDLYHNLNENLGGGATVGAAVFHGTGGGQIVEGISIYKGQPLVYKVTVELYEEGEYDAGFTGEPLYTLEGTKNNN